MRKVVLRGSWRLQHAHCVLINTLARMYIVDCKLNSSVARMTS